MEDQRRLFEYFIIAGLNEDEQLIEFHSSQQHENNSVCRRIAYKPAVLDCFPQVKSTEDSILVQNVPKFFLPMGATIEAWPERCKGMERTTIARTFSTCVFTDEAYNKYYGASVTFYELYRKSLSESQKEKLDLGQEDQAIFSKENEKIKLNRNSIYYCNKAICIVSRYPFFEPFRRFLYFLLNTITIGHSKIPIERYISHLMYEVPFPSQTRPRILMELGADMVAFESSDDSQIPLSGANFMETLKCLGVENLLYAMLLTLLEQKILVHSLRPWLLATVTETLCAIIFPFYWQLPYIPQCPLELAGIFHAPLSFMAGVDSRYFDLKEDPPSDVTCFDLDTGTISKSTIRKFYKLNLLPKKLLKRLRSALEAIVQKNANETGNLKDPEQAQLHRIHSELAIREAFLKFICSLMDGYTDYLCPLFEPPEGDAADFHRFFDWDHFLQSRDKNSLEFYQKFRETICFTRFIEERSGAIMDRTDVLDKSSYFVFFDDCIAKLKLEPPGGIAADFQRLFDWDHFLQSRDKNSFESYYMFFDDCIAKLKSVQFTMKSSNSKKKSLIKEEINNLRLIDCDSMRANRTIVIQSPHILDSELRNKEFFYDSFPQQFVDKYFEKDLIFQSFDDPTRQQFKENRRTTSGRKDYYLLLTRQEIRKSLTDTSMLLQQNALYWRSSVLFYAYSIWFMQLPSLMMVTRNKRKILIFAIRVLSRMEQLGLPFHDQMCFRLIMQLCGENNRPEIAVLILRRMFRLGIVPNAITYKIYHQCLIKSEWPSEMRRKAIDAWHRLNIRLEVCARFRSSLTQNGLVDGQAQNNKTISSSSENFMNTSGDFFFMYARRAKDILSINYWMQDILPEDDTELKNVWLRKDQNEESLEEYLDVLICSTSLCPNCNKLVYDDELTLGWACDDANWNSICPHCQHSFLPSLKICIQIKQNQERIESPDTSNCSNNIVPSGDGKIIRAFTVPYISPLVLRREIENLLENEGLLMLSRPSVRISHPIIFWNIFYYCRRLELPTHIFTWISPAVVIHCLQDMPKLPDGCPTEEMQQNK